MKLLCLHGAYGSGTKFKTQLSPFIAEVTKSNANQFEWVDGGYEAVPPPGFEAYFGAPPWRRFANFDGVKTLDSMVEKIRDFPEGLSAEDTMRRLTGGNDFGLGAGLQGSLERLFEIIDADPEIDGILGYSEGATIAATLILEERRRWEQEGIPRRIKCGVFFAGWPPVKLVDGRSECLLSDECEVVIDIPTCHIVGCKDPYINGALSLFNMCDQDTASLFDHGKGHTVPRDAMTIKELAFTITESMRRGQVACA